MFLAAFSRTLRAAASTGPTQLPSLCVRARQYADDVISARYKGPLVNAETYKAFFEEHIPFNVVLGLKVDSIERYRCAVSIPYKADLVGDATRGAIHGGVLAAVADAAGGLAVISTVDDLEARVATIDMRIDYLNPGKMNETLTCTAEVRRIGNRVATTSMRVTQKNGQYTVCEGRAVYNISMPRRHAAHPTGDHGPHKHGEKPSQ